MVAIHQNGGSGRNTFGQDMLQCRDVEQGMLSCSPLIDRHRWRFPIRGIVVVVVGWQ